MSFCPCSGFRVPRRTGLALWPLSILLWSGAVQAQEPISIDQPRRDFHTQRKKEVVSIRGWVLTEKRVASATFKGYYLKDRYGSSLLVP